jgi:hypothetical protein
MKIICLTFVAILASGCAMVSPTFVGNAGQSREVKDVQVFYRQEDVPYAFTVIGKVYVKNVNYWADRAPGKQAQAIKEEAAKAGADGVIIEEQKRLESNNYSGGEVYQLSGIAITKKQN